MFIFYTSMSQRELRTAVPLIIACAAGTIGNLFALLPTSVCNNFISTRSCILFPIISLDIKFEFCRCVTKPNAIINFYRLTGNQHLQHRVVRKRGRKTPLKKTSANKCMSQRELRTAVRSDIADATGIIGNLFPLIPASVCNNFINSRT